MGDSPSPFPRFLVWLAAHPDAVRSINITTLNRYASGAVPAQMLWFLQNPGALVALAEDAENLTGEDWERILAAINERAGAARDRRAAAKEPAESAEPESSRRRRRGKP